MGQAKGAGVGVSPTRLEQYLYVFAYIHTFTHSHIVDTARTPRFLAFLVVFVQGRKGLRVTVSRGGRSRNLRRGKEPEPAKGKEPHNHTYIHLIRHQAPGTRHGTPAGSGQQLDVSSIRFDGM